MKGPLPLLPQPELRRRIRAARELTGPSADEIAQRQTVEKRNPDPEHRGLSQRELGDRLVAADRELGYEAIGKLERGGSRVVKRHHLDWIVEVCDVPEDFFYTDGIIERRDPGEEHERALEGHVQTSRQPTGSTASDTPAHPAEGRPR